MAEGTYSSTWLKHDKGLPLAFVAEYDHLMGMRKLAESNPAPDGIDTLWFSPSIPILDDHCVVIRCTLWADGNDLVFLHDGNLIRLDAESFFAEIGEHDPGFRDELAARNKRLAFADPRPGAMKATNADKQTTILRAEYYPVQTSQEVDVLMEAASNGRSEQCWVDNLMARTRTYLPSPKHRRMVTHRVQLAPQDPDEDHDGIMETFRGLTKAQDADAMFAFMYVSRLLCDPSNPLSAPIASGVVDLNDVAAKVWPRESGKGTAQERKEQRAKVFAYLLFVERAKIVGERSVPYQDPVTRENIPTKIESSVWRILDKRVPLDETLCMYESFQVPVTVALAMSPEWTAIAKDPRLAQYLPMGEELGSIPANKPAGAWARVIGLALLNHWRTFSKETIERTKQPTRRDLMERYAPKSAPVADILSSSDPGRAIKYWHSALSILVERGILAKEGEAARKPDDVRKSLPRYDWQTQWLDAKVDLVPGSSLYQVVKDLADKRFEHKPKDLTAKRRPGRPRKQKPNTQ